MTQSATDMYNCTHGPKKDCAQCLVPELVKALEGFHADYGHFINCEGLYRLVHFNDHNEPCSFNCTQARAVLEKAKEAQG